MTLFLDPEVWNTYKQARNAVSIAVFRGINDILQECLSVESPPPALPVNKFEQVRGPWWEGVGQVNTFDHVTSHYMGTLVDRQNDRHDWKYYLPATSLAAG